MKRTRWFFAAITIAAVLAAFSGIAEAVAARNGAHARQVERGRYLTTIMGCNDCHTPGFFYGSPDFSRQLSGSELGWVGPWGVSFPRNLTPDAETGIASWSEHDIVTALRTGVRRDGSVLLPPMPWPNYATMSDADAYAIAAFLKSLPPVRHEAPKRVPPGTAYNGPALVFPAPPAWDAPVAPTSANTGSR